MWTSRLTEGVFGEYLYQVSPFVAAQISVLFPISEVSKGMVSLSKFIDFVGNSFVQNLQDTVYPKP